MEKVNNAKISVRQFLNNTKVLPIWLQISLETRSCFGSLSFINLGGSHSYVALKIVSPVFLNLFQAVTNFMWNLI